MAGDDICEAYNAFTSALCACSQQCFGLTSELVKPKYSKPWWSSKCNDVIKGRYRLKNVFRRHPTVVNKITFPGAEAIAKYEVKQSKRNS